MFAVICIPDFALQAVLRLEPEVYLQPAALMGFDARKPLIFELTPAARQLGVAEGMTAPQAVARCPGILFRPRNAALEATASELLLQCAWLFSPAIEATAPGVVTLDLRGLSGAGNEPWGMRIVRALEQLSLRGQAGAAANPGLALLAARCARPFLRVEDAAQFVSTQPIAALGASPQLLEILRKWGLRHLGELAALQREEVGARLGAEGLHLHEQALARGSRPLKLSRPVERRREEMDFENEVESLEPLLFVLRRFIGQIARRLELSYLAAEEIQLELRLASGEKYERNFRVPAPTRDADVLFRMLHTHLEGVRADHPIIGVALEAKPCAETQHQFHLFETALRDPNRFFETLSRLGALLGKDRVGAPLLANTHRPDAFSMAAPSLEIKDAPPSAAPACASEGLVLRRFRPPATAEVRWGGGQPAAMRTSRFARRIQRAFGPWKLSGDWWDSQRWEREEWDVQTEQGEMYRIFRQGAAWFVDGVYD